MPKLMIDLTPEQVAQMLRDLPPEQLKSILEKLADRVEIRDWMRLGEPGFREWLTEPDLYGDDRPAR